MYAANKISSWMCAHAEDGKGHIRIMPPYRVEQCLRLVTSTIKNVLPVDAIETFPKSIVTIVSPAVLRLRMSWMITSARPGRSTYWTPAKYSLAADSTRCRPNEAAVWVMHSPMAIGRTPAFGLGRPRSN